jgi:hypothetical protein
VPDPARPPYESQVGMGQHPLGPAQAAARFLSDSVIVAAGRDLLRAPLLAPVAEIDLPAASAAEASAPEPAAPSETATEEVVWVPRHPGVPDLPDDPPLSPIAQLARDNPEWAKWFLRRCGERLAELGWQETADGSFERIPAKKAQGP